MSRTHDVYVEWLHGSKTWTMKTGLTVEDGLNMREIAEKFLADHGIDEYSVVRLNITPVKSVTSSKPWWKFW